jgi:hypothetical protein
MALIRRVAKQIGLNLPDDSWEEVNGDESSAPPPTIEEEVAGVYGAETDAPPEGGVEPNDSDVINTGPSDKTMGMTPARRDKEIPHDKPVQRGRHVGAAALALVSRVPLVGLKWLRASSEFVIYDDQPPPSGEYVMQTLGISTLEYAGVKQNHLLVTFKSGQLTGFGMEDNSYSAEYLLVGVQTDYLIDVTVLLAARDGRAIVLNYNRNIAVKVNSITATAFALSAVQSPYIIDMGLNISKVYITTTKTSTVRLEVW